MIEQQRLYDVKMPDDCDEELVEQIALLEADTFSDAWSSDSIKDSLGKTYNMLFIATERMVDSENPDTTQEMLRGYLIAGNVAGESELLRIAVDDSCRGVGIGRMLMSAYIGRISRYAEKSILEVRSGNIVARSLYESLGYSEISVRKNYYHNPIEDGIVYIKQL